ncbi:hypothetical protein RKD54_001378 [Pseudarthrobacter sp. SLBN-100]
MLGIERFVQDQLAAEDTTRPLGSDQLNTFTNSVLALGTDGQNVLLNVHIDRLGLHSRQVNGHHE